MSTSGFHGEMRPASHTLKKREMVEMLAELDTNDDFFPTLITRVSDGVFLSTLAEELKVNHSILRNWIRGNKERDEAYKRAENDGKRRRAEKVLEQTYSLATKEISDAPTHMEKLRAAEIFLKAGAQEDAARAPSSIANIAITFVQAADGKPVEKVIDPVS